MILGLAYGVLEMPGGANLPLLLGESLLFILTTLALGLVISNVVEQQQTAMFVSLVGLLMPSLDVLVPVRDALERAPEDVLTAVRTTANEAREATRDMLATRGRASFLGERSRGHYDPGATSSQLLIHAVCDVLEARG
jgi:dihydroxyacetone kinase